MYRIITGLFFLLLISMKVFANQGLESEVRDPTTPLGQTGVVADDGTSQFTLHSILVSPKRKLAIINGNTLREGQTVPGSQNVWVQKISTQSVVLQQADQTWVLRLSPSVVKKHH